MAKRGKVELNDPPHAHPHAPLVPIRGDGPALEAQDGETSGHGAALLMADAEDAEYLLVNWSRWCIEVKNLGECDSIEHLWRSPQEWYEPPPPVVPRGPINRVLAIATNRAWGDTPQPYKQVLKEWYVFRRDPRRTCDRLGLAFSAHGEYLANGRLMVRNILTRQAVRA